MSKKKRNRLQFMRQKFPRRMQKKLVVLFIAMVLAFGFLIGRITYINASNGEKYTKIVLDQQRYDSRLIPFKRGDIVDRNGTVLATSERVYNVILDANVMLSSTKEDVKAKTIRQVKSALKECFGIESSVVDKIIETSPDSRYNILLKHVSYAQAKEFEALEEDKENYKYVSCVWLEEDYIRTYPYNTLASDIIGFTVAGNVGNAGMESSYNSILNGTDGREYGYLDTDSSLERTIKEPTNGNTLVSTIDIALQSIVEKHILAFNEAHKNEAREGNGSLNTAVIIANPNNGEILAEASYPNYNLNTPRDLTAYYTQDQIDAMKEDEKLEILNKLWKNFCVSDTYEAGSTIKPFTIASGLETGALLGNETYYCGGSLVVSKNAKGIKCNNRSGHGIQTLSDAIANSCNVALMHAAAKTGVTEFCKYQHLFGFGEYTGIDLPGEAETAGLLYNPNSMGPVELATNSFGQGFNVTMTQMVAGFSSLINGGNYYKPHIVKQIQDGNGNVIEDKEPVLIKKTVSERTSNLLKQYMAQTMTEGTGKRAQIEGYVMGGKTGTAEKLPRGNKKYLVSFIGFAPVENPEVLVYVIIDEPNVPNQSTGGHVTTLAKAIMEEAFPYLNITKASAE